jgi:hypothetical protein
MANRTVYIVTAQRGGFTSLLAMMYLGIFASLALGFYAATNTNSIVAHNENHAALALAAAESGADFMRYQLASMHLPYGTTPANLLANTANTLGDALDGTANMAGNTVSLYNGSIHIPSTSGWITIDGNTKARFRATITQETGSPRLIVTVRGSTATTTVTRAVRLQFKPTARSQALVGINSIAMSGSAFTDSYNSTLGAYNVATAGRNGSIGSNGDITLSNTARVKGDARPGPGKTVTLNDAATVTGSRFPLAAPVSYPSVILPAGIVDLGDISHSSGTHNVPGGTYLIRNLSLSGTAVINWQGPVTLYIRNSYSVTGSVVINTYQNNPKNRVINFLPTCTTATWNGTNTCVGDLYAPDTNFTVAGSVQKFGRIIAKSINNSSSGGMHADDALPQPGGMGSYEADFATYEEIK